MGTHGPKVTVVPSSIRSASLRLEKTTLSAKNVHNKTIRHFNHSDNMKLTISSISQCLIYVVLDWTTLSLFLLAKTEDNFQDPPSDFFGNEDNWFLWNGVPSFSLTDFRIKFLDKKFHFPIQPSNFSCLMDTVTHWWRIPATVLTSSSSYLWMSGWNLSQVALTSCAGPRSACSGQKPSKQWRSGWRAAHMPKWSGRLSSERDCWNPWWRDREKHVCFH